METIVLDEEKREKFASRIGFVFVSAGCAIGIGNVWKFPYVAGTNGGGVFVVFYLLFLVIMGIPVVTMELAMGRASGKTIIEGYRKLEKPGTKWHVHGLFCVIGCYILMMYYTVVSGWMVDYFFKFATGRFEGISEDDVGNVFDEMLANPWEMGLFMAITVIAGFIVLSFGVKKGLERVTRIMMPCLFVLIVVLAVYALTLPGAGRGVSFYLLPDWHAVREIGVWKVVSAAMNQAFFTLSLGMGCLEIFGSYMSRENTLTGEAVQICALDTFVAIMAGLIIFPACFSFHIEPTQGPSLIFIALPRIFIHMEHGRLVGALFFIFMTFACFSTIISVFENLTASLVDSFGWSRKLAILMNGIFLLAASVPCVFGFNVWSGLHLIGDRNIMDSEDFLVSSLLLPIGAMIFLLFCVSRFGWGFDRYLEEVNTGEGMKMPVFLKTYFRFVLPVLILLILLQGLIQ